MYKLYIRLMFKRKEFMFSFLFMLAISLMQFVSCCKKMYGLDVGQILSADKLFIGRAYENGYYTVLQFILPLTVVLPFSDIALQEEKNNTLPVILTRQEPKKTVICQMLVSAFGSFITVFVPFSINALLSLTAFPINSVNTSLYSVSALNDVYYSSALDNILLPNLFLQNPYAYNFVFLLLLGFFCALLGALLYLGSYYLHKNQIAFLFLVFLINNFLIIFTNKTGICVAPFEYLFAFTEIYEKLTWYAPFLFLLPCILIFLLIPKCAKKLISLR